MSKGLVPVRFSKLSNDYKTKLLQEWGCLRGIRLQSDDGPITSPLQIVSLPQYSGPTFEDMSQLPSLLHEEISSELSVETVYSSRGSWYQRSGFSLECLSKANTPWTAAFDTIEPRVWTSPAEHIAYATATFSHTRLRLRLSKDDLQTADDFVNAVKRALGEEGTRKFASLRAVFDRWGHVLPTHVELGGSISVTRKVTCSSKGDVLANERDLKRFLTQQSWPFDQLNLESESSIAISTLLRGGNYQSVDHKSWVESLSSSWSWEVIKIVSVISTISLLDDELQQQIEATRFDSTQTVPPRQPDLVPVYSLTSPYNSKDHVPEGSLSLSTSQAFTLSAWIRIPSNNINNQQCCFSIDSPAFQCYILWAGLDPSGHFKIYTLLAGQSGAINPLDSLSNVVEQAALRWVHVLVEHCMEESGDYRLTLHIDGQQDASVKLERSITTAEELRIVVGRGKTQNTLAFGWVGQVQGLKVFSRVLSAAEKLAETSDGNTC